MNATPETLEEISAGITRGALTSESIVQRSLRRIAAADPVLGAFVGVYAEHALRRAHALDAELVRGRVRGPLHGIPIALKDVFDVEGQPTTAGSRLLATHRAAKDAAVVTRLHQAGMIVIGKTRMVEFAFGGWGTNAVMGTPRNPWDLRIHRVPGGSSSGSAVAVAAMLVPAALGTDTGGSVRIPAALCGVVGLKTTAGLIPCDGVTPLAGTLDTIGPLTRSCADAVLLLAALMAEPTSAGVAVMPRPRIGVLDDRDLGELDADVARAYEDAKSHFEGLGASLQPFSFGLSFEDLVRKNGVLMAYEGWQAHGLTILQNPAAMDPHVLERFIAGRHISDAAYAAAMNVREEDRDRIAGGMAGVDAVLTPTTPLAAIPLEEVDEKTTPLNRFTRAVNYLGLPALAIPADLSAAGLPVSIQLIGKERDEPMLLALGALYERRRGAFPAPDLSSLGIP